MRERGVLQAFDARLLKKERRRAGIEDSPRNRSAAAIAGLPANWAAFTVMIALQGRATDTGIGMAFCHEHNLVEPRKADAEKRFGISVSLPPDDTFAKILGDGWEQLHWYASEGERDRAFDNMAIRHGYYRTTDDPTQVLVKITR